VSAAGIAGVVRRDGAPADTDQVSAIVAAQAHRGPAQIWSDGAAAFAAQGTGELVAGPDVLLLFDGRIDDRAALRVALGAAAPDDVDLVARAWDRWGGELGKHVQGDWVVVAWQPTRQRVTCLRSPFGARPFVWADDGRRFAFASQPAALLDLPDVDRSIDERAVAAYLCDAFDDDRRSFFTGIGCLPAGARLRVDNAGPSAPEPFWSLDPQREITAGSAEADADAFRTAFLTCVGDRLRTDESVGLELSGGLDSSLVAGAARAIVDPDLLPLPAYTMAFAESALNERRFVDAVVAGGGLTSRIVDEADIAPHGMAALAVAADSPYAVAGPVLEGTLFRRAAGDGIGVLLTGFDGDTVVSHGLAHLTDLALGGRVPTLMRELNEVHARMGWSRWATLRSQVLGPLAPAPVGAMRAWMRGESADPLAGTLLRRDVAARTGVLERLRSPNSAPHRPRARWEHHADLTDPMNVVAVEVLEQTAARAGIDVRHPFFDRRLAELGLALPGDRKLRDGRTRWVQRRAMVGLVPDVVRLRSDKAVLGPQMAARFIRGEWPAINQMVSSGGGPAEPFLDEGAMRSAYARCSATGSVRDSSALWSALLLKIWLEKLL
jgi:asparagine synthase (glutamine-hydrolysing)